MILTSDHGEGLGDHGESTHGLFAYEATLRVPLVVWAPGLFRPHVVREPVRHVDLLPTVLDVLGAPVPDGLPGRSLLPLLARRDDGSGRPSYFEALSASLNRRWAPLHGLREGRLKYIDLPLPELYDLEADPAEARNLVASRPEDLERLRGRLAALRAEDRGVQRVAESRDAVERLRALGYVSGSAEPKAEYTEDDDPKRLVDIDTRLSEMLSLYHAGRVDEAIGVGRDVLRRRPDTDLAHLQLAYLERARGNLDGAIAEARRAVERRRTDTESIALLGVYLTEAGRAREAVALLEPWAKGPDADLDVLTGLGMAFASTGRPEAALATLARAREEHPGNATVLVNIATVHLLQNDLTRPPGLRGRPRHRPERGSRAQRARCHRRARAAPARGHGALAARGRPQRRGLPDAVQPRLDAVGRRAPGGGAALPRGLPARRPAGARVAGHREGPGHPGGAAGAPALRPFGGTGVRMRLFLGVGSGSSWRPAAARPPGPFARPRSSSCRSTPCGPTAWAATATRRGGRRTSTASRARASSSTAPGATAR